ncbi:hypothetical protein AMTR_s00129p00079890 [Amborella trichopoda]|uniref:Uncharacterized protein n=1 Tax=Amborella trichopoda TaxID=13333 RepID=W1NKN8_AMBTC|nr:hypothetical protein AMTR_s00129p00079890 [Amborella trichopoda]
MPSSQSFHAESSTMGSLHTRAFSHLAFLTVNLRLASYPRHDLVRAPLGRWFASARRLGHLLPFVPGVPPIHAKPTTFHLSCFSFESFPSLPACHRQSLAWVLPGPLEAPLPYLYEAASPPWHHARSAFHDAHRVCKRHGHHLCPAQEVHPQDYLIVIQGHYGQIDLATPWAKVYVHPSSRAMVGFGL